MKIHSSQQIGNLCYRPSSYPLKYTDAQARCLSEGGFLAPITSEEIQTHLVAMIQEKMDKLKSFGESKKFWIDGLFDTSTNQWSWNNSLESFSTYVNWRYGIASESLIQRREEQHKDTCLLGAGCGESCFEGSKLLMNSANNFQWEADIANASYPYICQAFCPRFYRWFPLVKKCLKVYEELK